MYSVKEIYYTLQGEGAQTGRAAVFCRFTGCNLWTGREEDRARAICQFCDTDFVGTDGPGGGRFASARELAGAIDSYWRETAGKAGGRYVVFTGGEPLLQLDEALCQLLHEHSFEIAVETNGTRQVPAGVDWVTVSPKAGAPLVVTAGNELKLVYPQAGAPPELFAGLGFSSFYLQPMDGPSREDNTRLAIETCKRNPQWRLSLQTHKLVGLP